MLLTTDVVFVPGVGPARAKLLGEQLGIYTVCDLLGYYPYRYIDRTKFYNIAELADGMSYVQIKAKIIRYELRGTKPQRLVATIADASGTMELVWFKGIKWISDTYKVGQSYIIFGKPTRFGNVLNMAHPDMDLLTEANLNNCSGWQAIYSTTEKLKNKSLNSGVIRKMILAVLRIDTMPIDETLPDTILKQYHLMPRAKALHNIHMPESQQALQQAQFRLKFEELFYIQLQLLQHSRRRKEKFRGAIFSQVGDYFNNFYHRCLPFPLTGAQKRVIRTIREDMRSGKQMNRLLQGDVGSGKTIVATMCSLLALDNGYQACIMAPTEILAQQHYNSISALLEPIGVNVQLLTGSTKKKERVVIHEQLRNGQLQILIGTHALLEDDVQFQNLGFVTIDEQHRFGVEQRARLWNKNAVTPPHILVMTATPIPRTLAMTIYGDLDVSVIDELPPGRKPIATYHFFNEKRHEINRFISREVDKGRQIYIVYPLIHESKKLDLKNIEDGYQQVLHDFQNCKVSMVHGEMKAAVKDDEMQKFVNGQTQIMVATTVIEVGVNVPNASVMVIENADRFGLSQLHQLRGRVGRGAEQSFCLLLTKYEISGDTRKRLQIMVESNDGFEIAEADLKLRGPGDMEGTQQSGLPFELRIANLATDGELLTIARRVANDILEEDELLQQPENLPCRTQLEMMRKSKTNFGVIS